MPEPDDLAALTAELERYQNLWNGESDADAIEAACDMAADDLPRIIAALKQAGEWKRLLEESDNYGAFCRMKQTIAELRAGLEQCKAYVDNCLYIRVKETGVPWPDIADLLARTAPPEGQVMTWQPIETAPKDDEPVLVWYPKAFRGKGGCYVALWQDGAWWAAVHAFKFEPSHWMPLPSPPQPGATVVAPPPEGK